MKVLDVAVKTLREAVRQPRNFGITLGLPVVFMLIFGFAFGADDSNETFALAVVNADEGAMGASYVEGLSGLTYADGTQLVRVQSFASIEDARAAVRDRSMDGLLVLPSDFTARTTPTERPTSGGPLGTQPGTERVPPEGATVTLVGDPMFGDYSAIVRIVGSYTEGFNAQIRGEPPVVTVAQEDVASRELTAFDRIAPGLMVFAILNSMPGTAATLAREVETHTLDRFRQSPSRAWHLLGGVTLAQIVIAMASMGLMLLAARLMGFHNQGSYATAYVVAVGASVAVVGLGMMVAAFARTQQEAANMGVLVSVPASFLSGAFFALPAVDLFTWGERTVGLYDLIPTTHAVEAMRQVLTFGASLASVVTSLVALAGLGLVAFAVGVGLYRRMRLVPA